MNEDNDQGHSLSYWRLSYRQKFIRTLWTSVFLLLLIVIDPPDGTVWSLSIYGVLLLAVIVQAVYTFYRWQRDERHKA
ncbi:hypothetical protein [Prosthecobacter fluviatilis]|uniref:Uncharacterized protein n=1 Tax=Prosthecobacter fluviatilis TaxID=445931 RepID=A0ABW0KNC6_9BACT